LLDWVGSPFELDKKINVRWRKADFVLHIVLFILSIVVLALIAFKRQLF
jgi:hypothetical protein